MTGNPQILDAQLAQKVNETSPELMVCMLLGAAQRYLAQAVDAIERQDYPAKGRALYRVSAILDELGTRLSQEEGNDLAASLDLIYAWWGQELMVADVRREPERMRAISRSMGELKEAWEQAYEGRMNPTRLMVTFNTGQAIA